MRFDPKTVNIQIHIKKNEHLMKKILLLCCLLLSSCSNMKPEECRNANWRDIGYNDAIKGRSILLNNHTKACAKVNLTPNKKAYTTGHKLGSKKFCTYKNGFIIGRRGKDKTEICITPELAKPYYGGYKEGLAVYRQELYLKQMMLEMRERLHHTRDKHKHKHKNKDKYNHKH